MSSPVTETAATAVPVAARPKRQLVTMFAALALLSGACGSATQTPTWTLAPATASTAPSTSEPAATASPAPSPLALQPVTKVADTGAYAASVSLAALGDRVWLVWGEYDESTEMADAFLASSDDGGRTFSAPRNITNHGGIEEPQIAVTADGTLFMSAIEWAAEPSIGEFYPAWVQVFRSDDGGDTWQRKGRAPGPGDPQINLWLPSLAVTADGTDVLVTWNDTTPPEQTPEGTPGRIEGTLAIPRWASTSADGGATFEAPQPAALATCDCCGAEPFFVGDEASVAYRAIDSIEGDTDERDIWIGRRDADAWTTPIEVHDDGYELDHAGCPTSGPGVAVDGDRVTVGWWTGAEGRTGYWLARGTLDGFDTPISVYATDDRIGDVRVATAGDRAVMLVAVVGTHSGHEMASPSPTATAAPAGQAAHGLMVFVVGDEGEALHDPAMQVPTEWGPRYYDAATTTTGVVMAWVQPRDGGVSVLTRRIAP